MGPVPIRHGDPGDREWIKETLERDWGGTQLLVHDEEFDCLKLPSLIAGNQDGLLVYRIAECAEIILLQTREPGSGLGSSLVRALVEQLRTLGVSALRVTTTNDNLAALHFYQRRGFRLIRLRPGAVDRARLRKPTIPQVASSGLPIRDELELELRIR
jgi:GNAT superfamily N-acetyltransferase